MLIISRKDRVNAAVHHRSYFLESLEWLRGVSCIQNSVTHFYVARRTDVSGDVAGFARAKFVARVRFGIEAPHLLYLDGLLRVMQAHLRAGFQFAVKYPHMNDHTLVWIVN